MHHYKTKSYNEYVKKSERGRADQAEWNPVDRTPGYELRYKDAVDQFVEALREFGGDGSATDGENDERGIVERMEIVYDDSAWTTMKRVSPKYALYDLLG